MTHETKHDRTGISMDANILALGKRMAKDLGIPFSVFVSALIRNHSLRPCKDLVIFSAEETAKTARRSKRPRT